jgi:endonuclease YncB( thermonuclease family)
MMKIMYHTLKYKVRGSRFFDKLGMNCIRNTGYKIPELNCNYLVRICCMAAVVIPRRWAGVAPAWAGEVVDVPDARTVIVDHDGEKETVHMYALRVPEKGEQFAQEAYAFAAELLMDRIVEVKPQSSWGNRALIYIQGQSESVNEKMLGQGWAWVQEAYCEKAVLCGRLNAFQAEAERSTRGIWAKIPEDVPPWRWLKENR